MRGDERVGRQLVRPGVVAAVYITTIDQRSMASQAKGHAGTPFRGYAHLKEVWKGVSGGEVSTRYP